MENLEQTQVLHSSFCERSPAASREPLPLAFLRILNGPGFAGKAFPLYEGETFIGRDASCGIHLPTSSMSRRHAAFDVQRRASRLRDLNSLNGTLCGGVRLQPGVSWSIRHGDALRFGDISSQFLLLQSSSDDYFTGDEDVDAATQPLDMLPYMTEDKGLEQTNANDSPGFAVRCGPLRCTNNGETISGGTAAVTTHIKGVTATAISQMNVDGGEGVRSVNGCNVPALEGNVNVQHQQVQLKQHQGLTLDKTPGTMASGLPLPLYVTESQESIVSCSILPEPGLASSPVQTDCFTSPSIMIVPDSEEDEDQEDAGMASLMLDQHSTPARRQPAIPNFISDSDDTDLEGETGVFESTTDKATEQADFSLPRFQQSTSTQRGVPFHLDSDTDDELVGSNLEAVETSIKKSEGDQNDTDEREDDDDVPMLRNLSALPNGGMSQVIPVQRSPCYLADEPTQQFLLEEKPRTTMYALVSDEATQKYELDDLENNGSVPVPRGISEEYEEPQALIGIPGSLEAIECPVGNQNLSIAVTGNHGMDVSTTIDKETNIVMNEEAQLSETHLERSIDPNIGEVTETEKITMKRELHDVGCTSLRECKKDHTDERQNPRKSIDHSVDESWRNMAVQLPQKNDVTTVDPPEVDGPRRAATSETKDEGTVDGAGVTQEEGGMHVEEVQVKEGNLNEAADIQAEVKKMDSITGTRRKEDSAVGGSWSGGEEGSGGGNHQGGGIKVSGDGGSRPQDEKNVHGDCGFQEAESACAKEMQQVGSKEAKTKSNRGRGRGRRGREHKGYEDQCRQGQKQPPIRDDEVIPVQRSPCYLADEPTQQFLPAEKPPTTTYALVSDEATQKYELDDLENNGLAPGPRGISEEYEEPQALTAIPGSSEAIECPVGNQNLSIAATGNHGMDVSTTIDEETNFVMNDEAQLSETHLERGIDPNVGEVTETQKITMKRELRDISCTSLLECKKDHTDERQNPPKLIDHSVDESLRNMAVQLPQKNVTTVDPLEVDGPRRAAASETKDEEGTVDGDGVTQEEGGMHVEEVQVKEGNVNEAADIQAEVEKMDSITGTQRKEDSAVGGSWNGGEEGSGGGIKVSGDGGSQPQDEKNVHGDCGFQEAESSCAKEMQQVGSKEAKTQSNRGRGRGRRGKGHKRYEDQWKQGKKQPHKRDEEVSTSLSENSTRERRMSLRGDEREANKDAIRVETALRDPRDVSNNDGTTPSKSYPVLQGMRGQGCGRGRGKNRSKTMSKIIESGVFALLGGEDGNVEETTSTKQHPSPEEFPANSNLESVNELEDVSAGSSNNETKSNVFKRDCGEQEETRMNLQAEHAVTSPVGQEKLLTNVHIESNVDRQENAETNAKSNLTDGVSKSARGPKAGLTKRLVLVGGKEVLNDCKMAEINVLGQDEMQQVEKIRSGRLNIEATMCTTRRASARLCRGILESDGAGIRQNQGNSAIPKSKRLANARNSTRENCDEYTESRESSGGAEVEHKSARDGSVEMVGKAGNTATGLGTEKPSNTARQLRRTRTVNVINKGMRELMEKSDKSKNRHDFQNHDVISSSNKGNSDATSLQDVREEPVHKAEEKKDEKSVKDEDQGSDHCRSELEDPQEQQLRVTFEDYVADGRHGVTGKCEAIEQDGRTDSQVHIATNDLQSSPKNYGRGRRRKLPNVTQKTPGRRKKTTPEDADHLLTSESGNFDRIADDEKVESISIEPTPPEDEVSRSEHMMIKGEPDVIDLNISSDGMSACKSTTTRKRSGRQQQTSTNFEESMSGHVEQHGGKTRKSQRLGFDPEIPSDNVPTVKLKQLGPEDNEPHKGQIVPRVSEHHDDENSEHKPKNTQKSKVRKMKAESLAVGDKMEGPNRRTLRKRPASKATTTSTEQGPTTIHTMAGDFENVKVKRKNFDVGNELNNSSCDTELPDTLVSSGGSIAESSEMVCGERKEAKSNARGKKSPRDPQIANNCRRSSRFVSDELVALSSPDKSKVLVKTTRHTSQHVTRSRLDSLTFKVLFTGVLDDMGQEAVRKLGGSVTENPLEASHLVTDRVRRTVKFLCAVARGLPIVQPEWLKRSLQKKTILPEEDFLVQDTEAERRFAFCLHDSLAKACKEPCLQGMQVHVTCSVKPEPEHMSTIIKCAGGIFLPKMPHTLKDNVVIVSCEEDRSRWLPARQTGFLIASAELILTGILRQSAQAASFLLSDDPQSQESPNSTVNSSLFDKRCSGAASKHCTNKRK